MENTYRKIIDVRLLTTIIKIRRKIRDSAREITGFTMTYGFQYGVFVFFDFSFTRSQDRRLTSRQGKSRTRFDAEIPNHPTSAPKTLMVGVSRQREDRDRPSHRHVMWNSFNLENDIFYLIASTNMCCNIWLFITYRRTVHIDDDTNMRNSTSRLYALGKMFCWSS